RGRSRPPRTPTPQRQGLGQEVRSGTPRRRRRKRAPPSRSEAGPRGPSRPPPLHPIWIVGPAPSDPRPAFGAPATSYTTPLWAARPVVRQAPPIANPARDAGRETGR